MVCSLVVRGLVLEKGEKLKDRELARKSPLHDSAVVHLVVRRTAKVSWSAQGNEFELSISASDSAETVKRCGLACTPTCTLVAVWSRLGYSGGAWQSEHHTCSHVRSP